MRHFFRKKIGTVFVATALFLTSFAIPEIPQTQTIAEAAAMKLSKTSANLTVGDTLSLTVKGTAKKALWTSSNAAVAAVNKKGKVTAKAEGTAVITAKVGLKCKVKVKALQQENEESKQQGLSFSFLKDYVKNAPEQKLSNTISYAGADEVYSVYYLADTDSIQFTSAFDIKIGTDVYQSETTMTMQGDSGEGTFLWKLSQDGKEAAGASAVIEIPSYVKGQDVELSMSDGAEEEPYITIAQDSIRDSVAGWDQYVIKELFGDMFQGETVSLKDIGFSAYE